MTKARGWTDASEGLEAKGFGLQVNPEVGLQRLLEHPLEVEKDKGTDSYPRALSQNQSC